jgi:hypothetical protein
MKTVTIVLPDSVDLSQDEIQRLVLINIDIAQSQAAPLPGPADLQSLLQRPVPPEEAADIRHLIGLYYAERAADLVDAQWEENGWTPETMHEWVREHLRTAHGRRAA